MKPIVTFQKQPRHFWAHVKLLSEGRGYSSSNKIKRYTLSDLKKFLTSYGLSVSHLDEPIDGNTTYGDLIITYIVFFFQAEDGIRDGQVTGVQTCALPI